LTHATCDHILQLRVIRRARRERRVRRFNMALEGRFDCVISLYHDQGHIAAKTRDFYGTVTATLGLPVLRTSVDHGTAFDIAWQGVANPVSMKAAILAAVDILSR
jgi:4-hydroxythreonine-4-phosphate dehydrogenase